MPQPLTPKLFLGVAAVVVALLWFVGSCTRSPDVTYLYYPAHSETTVTVLQTVDCTSDKKRLVVLNSPTANTRYFADYSKNPFSIRIKSLDGTTVDTDFTFNFFEDGRLKGVNSSSTGQGESITKSAIGAAVALAPFVSMAVPVIAPSPLPPKIPGAPVGGGPIAECRFLDNWAGGEPLTLSYSKQIDLANAPDALIPLDPTPDSDAQYKALAGHLRPLRIRVASPATTVASARYNGGAKPAAVQLTLQQTAARQFEVLAGEDVIFKGDVIVPLPSTYALPLPKASRFGKQSFALTLSEAGAVMSIYYGQLTGAAGPLNSIAAFGTAAAPTSTATQAAGIKAQADLIAEQQRLVRCQAQPDKCK